MCGAALARHHCDLNDDLRQRLGQRSCVSWRQLWKFLVRLVVILKELNRAIRIGMHFRDSGYVLANLDSGYRNTCCTLFK